MQIMTHWMTSHARSIESVFGTNLTVYIQKKKNVDQKASR